MSEIMADDKGKEIKSIINKINKDARKGEAEETPLIFIAADRPELIETTYIPTGIDDMDKLLGGGFPSKSIIALHGDPGCGKTSLALMMAATYTQKGEYVLYVNTEGELSMDVAEMYGMDKEKFLHCNPYDIAEQPIDAIETFLYDQKNRVPSGLISLVIIDSINNLIAKKAVDKLEKEGSEGNNMATTAKLLAEFLARVSGRGLLRKNTMMILIAQDRANLNNPSGKGPNTIMSGGYALKYAAKIVVKLTRVQDLKNGDEIIGKILRWRVEKNNITGKLGTEEYSVVFGQGIDDADAVFQKASEFGYIYKDKELGNKGYRILLPDGDVEVREGIQAARDYVKLIQEVKKGLKKQLDKGNPKTPPVKSGNILEFKLNEEIEEND